MSMVGPAKRPAGFAKRVRSRRASSDSSGHCRGPKGERLMAATMGQVRRHEGVAAATDRDHPLVRR
jgi:hypothetical protein